MTASARDGSVRVDRDARGDLASLPSELGDAAPRGHEVLDYKKALVMNVHPDNEQWLPAGTQVDVFSRFSAAWITGFEIATALNGGYQLRRLSDRSVLPVTFVGDDLRRRHQYQR